MKNLIVTIILFSCLFLGCEEITNEFDIDSINLNDYPVIKDSLILRSLVYDNPVASGKDKYLGWMGISKDDYKSESEYEDVLKFQMQNFDEFFWETVNRDSIREESYARIRRKPYYLIRDSMTYRVMVMLHMSPAKFSCLV